jgi:Tetratricopeptide repeat-like domain
VLLDSKNYDQAAAQLDGAMPASFTALVADRRGDIFLAQAKKDEAKAQYLKAYAAFEERSEYRRLLEVKLTSLGVDTSALAPVTKDAAAKDATAKEEIAVAKPAADSAAVPAAGASAAAPAESAAASTPAAGGAK